MKEAHFVKLIKKNITLFNWMRIETTTMHGFPDLIGICPQMNTLFVEAKIAVGSKIKLSPHQVSMNVRLWRETGGCNYIMVFKKYGAPLSSEMIYLYEGWKSPSLTENGVNEPPTAEGWHTICRLLKKVHGSRTEKPK
tara:strand:+ start:2413 stop:2826 length:414 start_codon:yes stop_codon:yes gene_type:complete